MNTRPGGVWASTSIRAHIVLQLGCSLRLWHSTACQRSEAAAARVSLLFVITDDQRFDTIGGMNPALHTPTMDRLADQGVQFENAFVTSPVCAASRASLLTGLVERTHRFTFRTPALARSFTDQSYPALLRAAGYRTGHVGKFGIKAESGAIEAMFDVYEPLNRRPYFKERSDGTVRHLTDITADRAIEFLRTTEIGQPFALTLSFNAPHAEDDDERQYIWPESMDALYTDLAVPAPALSEPTFFAALPEFLKEPTLNRHRWYWRFDSPEKTRLMTQGYFRMISGVDAALGRVVGELARLGVADTTVILLISDNGYFLGERGYAGKWLPYEPSIRVPLLVYDPREPKRAGARLPQLALNIDLAPTLVALAGVPIPPAMQGRSLVPLLDGDPPADWRTDFFVEHLMEHEQIVKHEGVRGNRYKYVRYFEQDPVYEELYDLQVDPLEAHNLSADPSDADLLAEMRARCDELGDGYGGPYTDAHEAP